MTKQTTTQLLFCIAWGLLAWTPAVADQFHYKDLVLGDRAAGLGGAYTAISDDSSGMVYNPAGIFFSGERYLSVSVNAFSTSSETYQNIVPGKDYSYSSSVFMPTFFGFVQKAGIGKFGFSVAVPNADEIDQNDSITGLTNVADQGNIFKRRYFHKDVTYLVGPSYAIEWGKNFTIGMSLPVGIRTENVIDNQYAIYNSPVGATTRRWWFQESYRNTTTYSLHPKLGMQLMPAPKVSLGATVTVPIKIAGSGQYSSRYLITSSTNLPTGLVDNDIFSSEGTIKPRVPQVMKFSLGGAYFYSKQWLLSADFDYATGDANYRSADTAAVPYLIESTWNASLGSEYYLSDSMAVRLGFFTNRSNTSAVQEGQKDQMTHVNQYCGSLGATYFQQGSSISFTGTYGKGTGQGQGLGDSTAIQTVSRTTMTFLLSGSYQM